MLPTRPTDLLPSVLVERIVNHHKNLDPLGNQRFHQHSEEEIGDKVYFPSSFAEESVDTGEVLGFMESHSQDHLAYGVFAHGQHPTNHKRHEDTKTRSAEAPSEMNLVNPERICYRSLHLGVPPPQIFRKTGYARNALFFQGLSHT